MRTGRHKPRGMTLIEGILVLAVVVVLAAIAIPNFVKARTTRSWNPCQCSLLWMEKAKRDWAEQHNKAPGTTPTVSELAPYLTKTTPIWNNRKQTDAAKRLRPDPAALPVGMNCQFLIGRVGEPPTCSVHSPPWEETTFQEYYGRR
jgi:prepilin-type N-terminal cleavage/methylation domain-containing protein